MQSYSDLILLTNFEFFVLNKTNFIITHNKEEILPGNVTAIELGCFGFIYCTHF